MGRLGSVFSELGQLREWRCVGVKDQQAGVGVTCQKQQLYNTGGTSSSRMRVLTSLALQPQCPSASMLQEVEYSLHPTAWLLSSKHSKKPVGEGCQARSCRYSNSVVGRWAELVSQLRL